MYCSDRPLVGVAGAAIVSALLFFWHRDQTTHRTTECVDNGGCSMAVKVCCPQCKRSLFAPDAKPARKGKCPKCGSEFLVSSAVVSDSAKPAFTLDTNRESRSEPINRTQPSTSPPSAMASPSPNENTWSTRAESTLDVSVDCPQCRSSLQVTRAALGQHAKCPRCGNVFVVAIELGQPRPSEYSQQASSPRGQPTLPVAQMGDCPFRQPSSSTPQATQLNQTILAEINSRFWLLQAAIVGTFALFNFSGIGAGDVPSAAIGWPLAVLSAVAGVVLFYCVLRPPIPTVAQTLVSFLVTAIAGVIALLAFQEIADAATNTSKGPPLFWIVRLIGHAYQINQSFLNKPEHDIPFVVGLLATIFSNGLCEEFVKLAPAAYLIVTKKDLQYRDALFIGAASVSDSAWQRVCITRITSMGQVDTR